MSSSPPSHSSSSSREGAAIRGGNDGIDGIAATAALACGGGTEGAAIRGVACDDVTARYVASYMLLAALAVFCAIANNVTLFIGIAAGDAFVAFLRSCRLGHARRVQSLLITYVIGTTHKIGTATRMQA